MKEYSFINERKTVSKEAIHSVAASQAEGGLEWEISKP